MDCIVILLFRVELVTLDDPDAMAIALRFSNDFFILFTRCRHSGGGGVHTLGITVHCDILFLAARSSCYFWGVRGCSRGRVVSPEGNRTSRESRGRLHSRARVEYGTTLPFETLQYPLSASAAVGSKTENVAFRVSPLVEDPSLDIDGVAHDSGCGRSPVDAGAHGFPLSFRGFVRQR